MKNKESKNSIKTEKEYPKYSVLMSIYKKDNVEWLKYAIDCMLNQTVKPAEFVIVEDGPLTKELNKAIDAYLKVNSIFNVVKIEKNGGLGPALKLVLMQLNFMKILRTAFLMLICLRCQKVYINLLREDVLLDILEFYIENQKY